MVVVSFIKVESLHEKTVNCEAHRETALNIARKSICLLKNDKKLLPLSDACKTIAVVGPGADEPALGDYSINYEASHMVTVLDGIRQLAGEDLQHHPAHRHGLPRRVAGVQRPHADLLQPCGPDRQAGGGRPHLYAGEVIKRAPLGGTS